MYDITDPSTWTNVPKWLQELDRYCSENTQKLLVGSKCDLEADRKVDPDEVKDFAASMNLEHLTVSAKNQVNVDAVFNAITRLVMRSCDIEVKEDASSKKDAPKAPVAASDSSAKGCCIML